MKENKYTISEAARLLSVENHVLRYWEEELELKIPRNELGHRYYREEEIQLLHCIKELKNKGFQLKAVKEVLPDLEQKKLIDIHKLLTTQEELENQELEQLEQARQKEMTQREEVQRQDIQKENRRINSTGQGKKYFAIANFFADFLNRMLNKSIHLPVTGTSTYTQYEVGQHCLSFYRMKYFRMELNCIQFLFCVFCCCYRAVCCMCRDFKSRCRFGNVICMAHPNDCFF